MTGWIYREIANIEKELDEERLRASIDGVIEDKEPESREPICLGGAMFSGCMRTIFLKSPRPALCRDARPGHRPILQPLRQRQVAAGS